MLKILCLGSRVESVRCLDYLLNQVPDVVVVGVVRHCAVQNERTQMKYEQLIKKHHILEIDYNKISEVEYDLGISFLFDKKVQPKDVDRPKLGFLNMHLGPLPRFKGSNSVAFAIKRARKDNHYKFGVTLHYMDYKLDTGPIIDILEVPIFDDDRAYELFARASESILPLFVRNIHKIIASKQKIESKKQTNGEPRYFNLRGNLDHEVDLKSHPDEIYDNIRALTFPGKPKPFAMVGKYKVYLSLDDT